ncbi:MEI2-like protein 6 [Tanacetum coccineum]|uniref:MEI2-like protein 6 n=1 Tax=Tanacetum coccineum TaxID=301880 RepID=A0ABQ5C984_9ASTR
MANQTLFQKPLNPYATKPCIPTDIKHCLNVGYTFVNFTTSEAVWKSHVCITRKSWPLFKSKKIAQVVRAWIQSKNSLVKHFEDMRLCRPSKEYLLVWFDPPRDESMSCLTTKGMHTIGAVCASTLDQAKALISLTDDLSLLSNMAALESCPKHNMIAYLEKTEGNVEFHEASKPFEQQLRFRKTSSPRPSPTPIVPDSIPEPTGENLGDHSSNDTSLSQIHKDLSQTREKQLSKGESSVQRDPLFDVMPEDNIDHMETDNAQSEGRTREMVDEDKEIDEVRLSTEDVVSVETRGVSTDFEKVSTDRPIVSTDEQVEGTEEQVEGSEEIVEGTEEQREGTEDQTKEEIASQTSTQTPTSIIFGDDETIATLLINMSQAKAASKEKEKGGSILAEKLQEQEREQFTIEERAKFLHDTIAAQRKFLAQQRSEAIRNRPPTKNQLRNQMMPT